MHGVEKSVTKQSSSEIEVFHARLQSLSAVWARAGIPPAFSPVPDLFSVLEFKGRNTGSQEVKLVARNASVGVLCSFAR